MHRPRLDIFHFSKEKGGIRTEIAATNWSWGRNNPYTMGLKEYSGTANPSNTTQLLCRMLFDWEEWPMSADWYFMKKGFFGGAKTVGPIAEFDFLKRIEKGEIAPETMVSSTSKTHGHWMHLKEIRAAFQHWKKSHPTAK